MKSRLDAQAESRTQAKGGDGGHNATCLECGAPYRRRTSDNDFCGPACRKTFNNRRATRGAELYDLYMALRHERKAATEHNVWRLLNRMASQFREEDVRDRRGRKSWRSPRDILARHPWLKAVSFAVKAGRMR